MTFNDMLTSFVQRGASDIHLHAGLLPMVRLSGRLTPVGETKLTPAVTATLVDIMCDARQKARFLEHHQVDLAYSIPGVARFRVNLFRQRGSVSAVLRVINSDESQLKVVNLAPELLRYFRDQEKGLILVTGPTGSGKSTTLTRIIDEINSVHNKMIITVEDPIEYLHRPKRSVIVQREIGVDALSFSEALVAAMRQDPEVIMIGEIRDYATASAAISAAQTGHLVLSTLHTLDTVRTVNRVLELFPPYERASARILFADALVGIVSQRLLPRVGGGRVAALEVMKGTLRIKDLLRDESRYGELYDALKDSKLDGMQLFDDALADLYAAGAIAFDTGLHAATSAQAFKLAATQIDLQRSEGREGVFG
ncbi:type IV pilus twitching motility protein PilT [Truepera radiovictrix]|nr:PilT/PilU family type 4a pilus ATPase [Truepera radiovictrix]WMT56208.1 PilT/PilU family type 4a pilus ATPase [Truepera radiovictrix]